MKQEAKRRTTEPRRRGKEHVATECQRNPKTPARGHTGLTPDPCPDPPEREVPTRAVARGGTARRGDIRATKYPESPSGEKSVAVATEERKAGRREASPNVRPRRAQSVTRVRRQIPSGFPAKPSPNRGRHLPEDPIRGRGERSRENTREMIVPERPRDEDRVINDARPDLGVRKLLAPHGDEIASPITGVRYGGAPGGGPIGGHPNPTP